MARILCLCPSHRDRRELPRWANGHELLFHEYASLELEQMTVPGAPAASVGDIEREIDAVLGLCRARRIDAVVSTDDYPGAALASVVAHEAGLPGPAPRASLLCQHKYHARRVQALAAPDCVPAFEAVAVSRVGSLPGIGLPAFVKPVKSFFSVGAACVRDLAQLDACRRRWRGLGAFFRPLEAMLRTYAGESLGDELLAEGVLEGAQATLECYVHAGRVRPLGVVDSVFHRGTLAFKRFEYPSRLPPAVQERMVEAAGRVLGALGYDNAIANVEFIYEPRRDRLGIVEINPRMSSQFADLFEKVDGTNSYETLLALALGRAPRARRGRGRHRFAASCVLRRFRDRLVRRVPRQHELDALVGQGDIRIEVLAEPGKRLSEQMQDECSFRYGVINLGGASRADVLARQARIARRLGFAFEPEGK